MSLIIAAAVLLFRPQEAPPRGAADWKVEVVARYPDIKFPSVLCFAPDGRLFIAEDPMDMDGPVNKPIDRILCMHPDGKVTVFAEGLYAVFGLQYLDGKLFVHHTPRFSVFRDENGVGKDRLDLIECTNPNPAPGFNDHIPSNCRIAMDGFLYISTGDKGIYGAVGKDGKKAEIFGGGIARMRPDGTDLEVYSTGTRNHLDVAVNAEDELFTYDNTDDGHGWWTRATHMVDGGFYGYPWDYKPRRPYTLWMMGDYGGGSGCASIAYNEDALPGKFRGNLFLSDWARKEVLRLDVTRDGATYKINSTEKFLVGQSPSEFRPLGLAVSPDGMSLYVCDWNYGGWVAKGKQTGRLIKATYTGAPSAAAAKPAWYVPAATAKPFEATNEELIRGLSHSSHEVRLVAQRRLADRKAVKELEGALATGTAAAKRHAIWALDAIGGSKSIQGALMDSDASVRRQAARQLGTRRVREGTDALAALLKDGDAAVRFQAATALGRIGNAAAVPALQAALEEKDLFARYAAFTALTRIGRTDSTAWGAIVKGLSSSIPSVREGTRFAMREVYEEPLAAALAAAPRTAETIAALAEIHRRPAAWTGKWWGTQPVAQPRPPKTVEYGGTKIVVETLRAALGDADPAIRRAAIAGVSVTRDASSAPTLRELYAKEADVEVKKGVLAALGAMKDAGAADLVAAALIDPALSADAVAAAEAIGGPAIVKVLAKVAHERGTLESVAALGRLKGPASAIQKHASHGDLRVATAVAVALGQMGGDVAAATLVRMVEDERVELRRAAIASLGAVGGAAAVGPLLKAYLDKETRFEAIAALANVPDLRALDAYLEGLGGKNATVRDACRKAVAAVAGPALPLLEQRLDRQELSGDLIGELQRLYNKPVPVVEWRILGAFKQPCAEPFPVDAMPPADAEYRDGKGQPIRWKRAKSAADTGRVNLREQMTIQDDCNAYAVTELESASERDVEFVFGSDDWITLWLNGKKIFEDTGNHGWKADAFRARGRLVAGKNLLVVKCGNAGGGWEFSVSYPAPRKGKLFEAAAKKLDPKAYAEFARKTAGDAARGRALFADAKGVACIKCHRLGGEGGEVGPDLAGVGIKYGRDHFVESILYPSVKILDGYKQTVVLTKSGDVKSGRFLGETVDELTLMDAEGKRLAFRKGDLEGRKEAELSMMPDGLNAGLSLQDFADLVAFLESLKEPPKK